MRAVHVVFLAVFISGWSLTVAADEASKISSARTDVNGFLIHTVRSECQAGATKIKVLLPDRLEQNKRYPILYVLPVEAGDEERWGNGLLEVKKSNIHNKHGLICVYPTFSHLPWYADHPTDPEIRQENYLLNVVVPFIDRTYPGDDRILIGFSKSGWGAFSLLLRHPDVFGKAVAWDAPLMMEKPNKYGMGEIFGSQENFEKYQISALLREMSGKLDGGIRLFHFGYGNFREHHESAHQLMKELGIAHEYRDGPQRDHSWGGGWLVEAVEMLVGQAE